jgi:hypothetical protein
MYCRTDLNDTAEGLEAVELLLAVSWVVVPLDHI